MDTVDIGVLHHSASKVGELIRMTSSVHRSILGKSLLDLLRHGARKWGLEDARGDGSNSNPELTKISGHGEDHTV